MMESSGGGDGTCDGGIGLYDNLTTKMDILRDWTDDNEQILLEPYTYLLSNPGKEIRTALIDAFNSWLCVPEENLKVVKNLVRLLHSASLLIDDVEDDSELRRGNPVAHKIYGIPQTLNCSNYVMFLAYKEIDKLNVDIPHRDIYRMVNEELINLHRGQGMDLYWRDNLVCPTEKEYLTMVNNKTGGLFRIAIKLMLLSSPKKDLDLIPLVNLLGVIFQIRDDYSNLRSSTYAENKGFCEDITEGKFSFPIIHAIRADQSNRGIINILRQKTDQREVKEWVVRYLNEKTQSFEYTRKVLEKLLKQAADHVQKLGGNPALIVILGKFKVEE